MVFGRNPKGQLRKIHSMRNDGKSPNITEKMAEQLLEKNVQEIRLIGEVANGRMPLDNFREKLMEIEMDRLQTGIQYAEAKEGRPILPRKSLSALPSPGDFNGPRE